MKRLFMALLAIVAAAGFARAANAQYMYLDANGNGIHDTGDRLNPNGTPTTVDMYVRTNQNRDGSTAVCDTGDGPLTINVYWINLLAVDGAVSYSGFINRQPTMTTGFGELNPDGVRYKNGFGGATQLAPGQYRCCTLTITGVSGAPRIDIVDLVSGSVDFTGFGTACSGHAFDNTYRLDGPNVPPFTGDVGDFTDWDGLGGGGTNSPPVLAPIGPKSACGVGNALTFTATATDPDAGQTLTFSLDPGAPSGATINATTGVFSWTPIAMGTFPATIRVTDNALFPLSDFEAFTISVGGAPTPPVLAAIGNRTIAELATLTFTAAAFSSCPGLTITFSLDSGAPAGASINPTSGVFSWTPTEAQGPGSYPITVRATDDGVPPLSDAETITVAVNEVNAAPVLNAIGNKSGTIGIPVTFTAIATDADIPANALTFSLDTGAPAGATINASTGAFTWTPSTCGTFPVTVRVTDNGSPTLSDFEVFAIVLSGPCEVGPPVLAAIGNKTVNELSALSFTATATDPNPGAILTFSLDAGFPAGATINGATGAFSWIPTEAQGPGSYPITVRVTNNASPSLSDIEMIVVTVNEVNSVPVVANPGNKTTNELVNLAFTVTATDTDLPPQTITWSLTLGTPVAAGATIGAGTGEFNWIPTESQGPGTFPVTIRATDNGPGTLSGTAAITITVNEVNVAPLLAPIGNKAACPGAPFTFTATATDADIPGNALTFSLDAGAPAGATIGAASGVFSWTPPVTGGAFPVTVRVTDNAPFGGPPLSDFEVVSITVSLGANSAPVLGVIGNKTIDELATLTFTATATDADASQTLTFAMDAGSPAGAAITAGGVFSWTPTEAQGPGGYAITVRVTDNGCTVLSDFESITVTVNEVNSRPVLNAIGNKTVTAGSTLTFTATATDPDLPPNTLCFTLDSFPPPGARATIDCDTGAFSWTPDQTPGVYRITVRVTDNGLPPLTGAETILVTILPQTTAPTAQAGGPYSGVVNAPVSLDGTGSSDPNGDALTYHWDFGDGNTGSGPTPSHAYTAPGTYSVTLRVTDPDGNFDDDVTSATIGDQISVALVLKNGKSTLDLNGNELLKAAIENTELVYTDVILSSVRLSTDYPNAGTVSECPADPKHTRVGDLDRNGVPDLEVRFSLDCMRNLFRNVPNNTTVNLIITGDVRTTIGPVPLRGVAVVTVKKGGGGGAPVLVYPNPMNPQAILSFVTNQAGGASVQLFDLQGRLVRTLLPEQHLEAGAHEVTIDGMNDQGTRLSSGIYFYRVRTADGVSEGSVSVLK